MRVLLRPAADPRPARAPPPPVAAPRYRSPYSRRAARSHAAIPGPSAPRPEQPRVRPPGDAPRPPPARPDRAPPLRQGPAAAACRPPVPAACPGPAPLRCSSAAGRVGGRGGSAAGCAVAGPARAVRQRCGQPRGGQGACARRRRTGSGGVGGVVLREAPALVWVCS